MFSFIWYNRLTRQKKSKLWNGITCTYSYTYQTFSQDLNVNLYLYYDQQPRQNPSYDNMYVNIHLLHASVAISRQKPGVFSSFVQCMRELDMSN